MPCEGECPMYGRRRRRGASERLQRERAQCGGPTRQSRVTPPAFAPVDGLAYDAWVPDWTIALDGNVTPVTLENGYPGAEAAYFTIAAVLLNMNLIRQLGQQRPADPQLVLQTEKADAVDCALPGTNVIF